MRREISTMAWCVGVILLPLSPSENLESSVLAQNLLKLVGSIATSVDVQNITHHVEV
jgi:hypothetical protein